MSGGMRIDAKELPIRHQEQLASAILARIAKTPPVAVREERPLRNIRPVRRLIFRNERAACRYRILRKQAQAGQISDLRLHRNSDGVITCFTFVYTTMEVF